MAKKRNSASGKRGGGMSALAVIASAVLLFIVALPTFVTLVVGLLPSLIAFIFDRQSGRYMARCIFGLNFSGVAPYIMELWKDGAQGIGAATQQLTDPMAMSIMYGAAGLGWLLYLAMPPIVANVLNLTAQRRMTELRKKQQELVKSWGDNLIREVERTGG